MKEKMIRQLIVTLNTEMYSKTIEPLSDCFLRGCTVAVASNSDDTITQEMKQKAVREYWVQAKGTGGYKRQEKMNPKLFSFALI
jgi:hypothetical protein